jgi:hypothetical protein
MVIDPKAPDHNYTEWPVLAELILNAKKEFVKDLGYPDPTINDIRKKLGYPAYDGSLEDALKLIKENND